MRKILTNRVYKGELVYQRTERIKGSKNDKKTRTKMRAEKDWIIIPVPAIVDEATWDRAQAQLTKNTVYSRRNQKRYRYLVSGQIVCIYCGRKWTGAARNGVRRYRCSNTDKLVGTVHCAPKPVNTDLLEEAVWAAVANALKRPELLAAEYKRRIELIQSPTSLQSERRLTDERWSGYAQNGPASYNSWRNRKGANARRSTRRMRWSKSNGFAARWR